MFLITITRPFLKVYFKIWRRGSNNIPKRGRAIIACNHQSAIDSLIVPICCPRMIHYMGKSDYFEGGSIKKEIQKWFLTKVGVFPVERRVPGQSANSAIKTSIEVLKKGHLFGIYPEGTRSRDGKLHKGRTGVARIAWKTKSDIIPTAVFGTEKAMEVGKTMPKGVKCGTIFGDPIKMTRWTGREENKELYREITDTVMKEIEKLLGKEYIDEYSPIPKRNQ
jgi:1-acyl-sn-glycerol-3-phosphate acyltransferase